MNFTESQLRALDEFRKFLEGSEQVYILKGAAGTGKTTLVTEFLRILRTRKREHALMAPNGRAAYIIGGKTGCPASTIHRGIYGLTRLQSIADKTDDNEEKDNQNLYVSFGLRNNKDSYSKVYLVDEASMVSDTFSENEAFSFGSGCILSVLFEFIGDRKIILIGDYAQLPPIGMNFSPALDKEYIEKKFNCSVTEVMLKEVLRQSGRSSVR